MAPGGRRSLHLVQPPPLCAPAALGPSPPCRSLRPAMTPSGRAAGRSHAPLRHGGGDAGHLVPLYPGESRGCPFGGGRPLSQLPLPVPEFLRLGPLPLIPGSRPSGSLLLGGAGRGAAVVFLLLSVCPIWAGSRRGGGGGGGRGEVLLILGTEWRVRRRGLASGFSPTETQLPPRWESESISLLLLLLHTPLPFGLHLRGACESALGPFVGGEKCLGSGLQLFSGRGLVPGIHGPCYRICGPGVELQPAKSYSSGSRKGFLSGLVDNIKQELAKNKEMKESIKKFRDEAKKLEESDALQEARRKYKTIESETVKTSEVIKKKFEEITGTMKESLDEVSKSDIGRKIKEGVEEAAKTAKQSAESVSKGGEKLGKTAAFKAFSQGVETVKKELDESVLGQTGPYRRPERLRKRTEFAGEKIKEEKVFEPNEEAMGVVLHKDSKWYQQWKDFKDNNVVFNRFFEMKMKYDESDNAFIRVSRAVTDKVTDLLGGLFSKTEMSEVLTEILKVDPTFDKDHFLRQCKDDIIPNILEAMIAGELDILKDWCYEATYSQLAHPIQQAKAMGLQFHSRILDIDNIDLAMGKMMEQGPVLIITFQAQLVMVIKNPKGEVVEGDPVRESGPEPAGLMWVGRG
uniref:Mitochondrial import inner membrane translocase subunit TIM44 n=1 Tax=Ornithorhynchus anatinus TaxID=9258 RepID=A0A6I8NT76_ORNAN